MSVMDKRDGRSRVKPSVTFADTDAHATAQRGSERTCEECHAVLLPAAFPPRRLLGAHSVR